jgi:hypothetical protein
VRVASVVVWGGLLLSGWTWETRLPAHPFPLPRGAPGIVAHAVDGRAAEDPIHLVLFLHGWNGCARVLLHAGSTRCRDGGPPQRGWGLAAAHGSAGTDTVLLVPQLAWRARDGTPGRLRDGDFARRFMGHARRALAKPLGRVPEIGPITLVAHSAGYATALALMDLPGVRHVVLLDALYAGRPKFAAWLAADADRRLVSVHIGRGKPHRHTRDLARQVRRELSADAVATVQARPGWEAAIARHRLTVARSHHGHGALPRRHLAQILRGLAR